MPEASRSGKPRARRRVGRVLLCGFLLAIRSLAHAAECAPEPQGEGRVQAVIDGRTLRLEDGRIVRLAGLAALRGPHAQLGARTLETLAVGRMLSLHDDSDMPDRYGRQHVWAFAEGQDQSLQAVLAGAGGGVRDIGAMPPGCRETLANAEADARTNRKGLWATPQFSKKAESGDDISAEIGHFTIVEGRVRSVRMSGGTTYLNFGRRWTEGFAVILPKAAVAVFEAAATPAKAFEGKRVLARGYVVRRGGPRIEALGPDQIELTGADAGIAGTRD